MANTKKTYKPVGTDEQVSAEYDDLQDHRPRTSRWPNASTIVLSITTAIFALHSIYLTLQGNCACVGKGALAFDAGYSTEWGTKSPLVHRHAKLIIKQSQRDHRSSFRESNSTAGFDTMKLRKRIIASMIRPNLNTLGLPVQRSTEHGKNCWEVCKSVRKKCD